jgi:hypothetical protein
MASSGMLHRVAFVRHNIPENAILHSHCRENLKSYMVFNVVFSFVFWAIFNEM